MSRLVLEVTLAPYLQEEFRELVKEYEGRQDTPGMRAAVEADAAYRLCTRLGVPQGTFMVRAISSGPEEITEVKTV